MPEAAESLLYNYDQNQTILCRSQAERNEMAFTESLLLQKGHFLSSPQKGIFSLLKMWVCTCPHCPPVPRPLINAKSGNIRPFTDFILRP